MKFTSFKEFKGLDLQIQNVIDYLSIDLRKILRDLQLGLTKMEFTDNFESFQTTVTIASGSEIAIRNELSIVPTQRLIVAGNSNEVVDGDTAWNNDFVFLKNIGATEATVTVIFLK